MRFKRCESVFLLYLSILSRNENADESNNNANGSLIKDIQKNIIWHQQKIGRVCVNALGAD